MFKKIEALIHSKHQNLRFTRAANYGFAENLSMVKASFAEMRQASLYYPVIFREEKPGLPTILLSLEAGSNRYLDENKMWKVPYVPTMLKLYPFTLAKMEDDPDKMVLCIDPEAPHFASGQGEPLFTADGQLADFVTGVMKELEKYQKELAMTEAMVKRLYDNELIAPRKFRVRAGGQPHKIDGFWGVDMEKLPGLEDKILAELVRTGTLSMIYEHAHSMNKFLHLIASKRAPA